MTIDEAQTTVDKWIKQYGVRYFNELTNMVLLTEEVGEVARIMARTYGEQSFKDTDNGKQLADELADVLWVLICIANQTGINLTQAFENNIAKKTKRDNKRHLENIKLKYTDDCSAVERLGMSVKIVEGDERNIKVTTPMDLKIAALLLEEMQ